MDDVAISVKNLTKIYPMYDHPKDRFKEALHPFRKKYHTEFYALKDISFDIKRGDSVGLIGRNGAGKSTLLKVITGVLTATSGEVVVNGRIASLLELGAGFNPEMTGIQNIYLNGSLMGYSRAEVDMKLDEIIAFADVGEHINQPVKGYSSGMFARLAFALAINVEPDILIVDEALSVGDLAFQRKCFERMGEINELGATVLFVSHDLPAVERFCEYSIWFSNGQMKMQGDTQSVSQEYLSHMNYGMTSNQFQNTFNEKEQKFFGHGGGIIKSYNLRDQDLQVCQQMKQGEWVHFEADVFANQDLTDVGIGLLFRDRLDNKLLTINSYMYSSPLDRLASGKQAKITVSFKVPKLYPGNYLLSIALSEGTLSKHVQHHWIHDAMTLEVLSKDSIDACLVSLYEEEVGFKYEQI